MSEPKKLGVTQHISGWTLRESDKLPSEIFRYMEADLIGRLAREAALAGLRFDGWPTIRLEQEGPEPYFRDSWRLAATVVTK